MNLWLRILFVWLAAFFKPRITHVLTPSRLTMRVMPNDLDTNGHMNNGRYFTIMDLGRYDLILRTGLRHLMNQQKSVPVLAATTIRHRLDLDIWQKFHLDTRIVCWDQKWMWLEQRFIYANGPKAGVVAAIALLKGGFYDRKTKTTLPTQTLLDAVGITDHSPAFPPEITAWIAAEEVLKQVTKPAEQGKNAA